ncbi:MAG: hypothetical protein ACPG32_06635 [Akkermansiaceae bacterium]
MEHLDGRVILLILFVVISGVKWLAERVKNNRSPHDVNEQLEDIYDDFREEIRRRQTEVQQPTQQQPARQPVRQPVQRQTPPPIPISAPPVQPRSTQIAQAVEEDTQARFRRKIERPKLTNEEQEAMQRFQKMGGKRRKRTTSSSDLSIKALLSNSASARKAVILQEVLGPPKSMQA